MFRLDAPPPNRRAPMMAPGSYRTYTIDQPADITVKAACEDVGCAAWRHGWQTTVDETTDLGRSQAAYIRGRAGRTYTEVVSYDLAATVFMFERGQRCFQEHRTRPATFGVHLGDWRADLGHVRTHTRPTDWVEDFAEHQQGLADQIQEG